MTDQVDCVVVGAGVVGLAVARALAQGAFEKRLPKIVTPNGCNIESSHAAGWRRPPQPAPALPECACAPKPVKILSVCPMGTSQRKRA